MNAVDEQGRFDRVRTVVFADVYLQPDAADPVLDERVVIEVARRHAPGAGPPVEVDESGGEARAYLLHGDVVVKAQRPHRRRPRTSLAKEAFLLGELHRQVDLPLPRVLGHGRVGATEYLCLTRVPGTPLARTDLGADARRHALGALGRTLRTIHGVDQSVLAASDLLPGDRTAAELRPRLTGIFARLAAAFERDPRLSAIADVRRIAVERLAAVPDGPDPVSLHSNPGPEHTFVDPGSGELTGLIDFGDAYRTHPAFDLRPWLAADDATSILDGYQSAGPLPPHFEDVHRTVLLAGALDRAARGKDTPEQASATVERLLGRGLGGARRG